MSKRAQPGAPAIGAAGTRVQAGDASTERAMLFLGHLVALCTARTRPAPRNNRASTIIHAKTRTAWRTGDWGCGHACTGRERGHQAAHARAGVACIFASTSNDTHAQGFSKHPFPSSQLVSTALLALNEARASMLIYQPWTLPILLRLLSCTKRRAALVRRGAES